VQSLASALRRIADSTARELAEFDDAFQPEDPALNLTVASQANIDYSEFEPGLGARIEPSTLTDRWPVWPGRPGVRISLENAPAGRSSIAPGGRRWKDTFPAVPMATGSIISAGFTADVSMSEDSVYMAS